MGNFSSFTIDQTEIIILQFGSLRFTLITLLYWYGGVIRNSNLLRIIRKTRPRSLLVIYGHSSLFTGRTVAEHTRATLRKRHNK